MAKDNKPAVEEVDGVERIRKAARPDFSNPPPRKQLPKELQTVLDNDEKMWETVSDGRYSSTSDHRTCSVPYSKQS